MPLHRNRSILIHPLILAGCEPRAESRCRSTSGIDLGPSFNPRWMRAPSGVEGESNSNLGTCPDLGPSSYPVPLAKSKGILVQMHVAGVCDTPLRKLENLLLNE